MNFNGKVAIITGSSSGIGEAIALLLSTMDANVVITGRNQKRIDSVIKQCQSSLTTSGRALGVRADLLVDSDIEILVNKTIGEFGRIDILVNNAGIGSTVEFTDENYMLAYDQVMATNVRCVQVLTRLALPYLVESKGNIVNISSIAGLAPNPSTVAYCMAKSALDMFTKCLALELGPKGVRVNSVNPAAIRTPIFNAVTGDNRMLDYVEKFCQQTYPLGRIGEARDVAEAVAYLASDRASFVTGLICPIDGGCLRTGATILDPDAIKFD
ncbi:glucose 1-dehydrogenase 1-like [Oppia nitens]|uniref:glucose 1-dehydrogenase 1-like n=1 Tax=Oppia nitens TaxID=1686743 RepID=UPI0023DA4C55|nr:glucose 1-dehydrogenase 1-like [Oppia nitens]